MKIDLYRIVESRYILRLAVSFEKLSDSKAREYMDAFQASYQTGDNVWICDTRPDGWKLLALQFPGLKSLVLYAASPSGDVWRSDPDQVNKLPNLEEFQNFCDTKKPITSDQLKSLGMRMLPFNFEDPYPERVKQPQITKPGISQDLASIIKLGRVPEVLKFVETIFSQIAPTPFMTNETKREAVFFFHDNWYIIQLSFPGKFLYVAVNANPKWYTNKVSEVYLKSEYFSELDRRNRTNAYGATEYFDDLFRMKDVNRVSLLANGFKRKRLERGISLVASESEYPKLHHIPKLVD